MSRQEWHEVRLLDDKAVVHWACVGEMGGTCAGQVMWMEAARGRRGGIFQVDFLESHPSGSAVVPCI